MAENKFSVRELTLDDVQSIADYWLHSDDDHLKNMGVDLTKRPRRQEFTAMLHHQLSLPIEQRNAYCLIWELNGEAIGHSNTNPTKYGDEAHFHTHIWTATFRKSGYGRQFLWMSIKTFFEKLKLNKLVGEPYAKNPAPNRLLSNLGFTCTKEYVTVPGTINFEQEVKRWELSRDAFEKLNMTPR